MVVDDNSYKVWTLKEMVMVMGIENNNNGTGKRR